MHPLSDSNLVTEIVCEHSWSLTPQSKSYWDIPKLDPAVVCYHLVCLKCGTMERCIIGDFRQTIFKRCIACINHEFCNLGHCQHQSESLTSLLDWVDSKRPIL